MVPETTLVVPPTSAVTESVGTIRTSHGALLTRSSVCQRKRSDCVSGGVTTDAVPVASVVVSATGCHWSEPRTWRTTG